MPDRMVGRINRPIPYSVLPGGLVAIVREELICKPPDQLQRAGIALLGITVEEYLVTQLVQCVAFSSFGLDHPCYILSRINKLKAIQK